MSDALVIGAGPAGLMAAGELARAGLSVVVAEQMPTAGRKFLMAGKSGLNLTMDEPLTTLSGHYSGVPLGPALAAFDSGAVQEWARHLGQEVFTGSSGRVFPTAMKASPLLRAWLAELRTAGADLRTRWRWTGWEGDEFHFATPDGPVTVRPKVCVLALGGASWAKLGSDGVWAETLANAGIETAPFVASNAGLTMDWSPHMAQVFGQPVKGVAIHGGGQVFRGEFVISRNGLEGGGIYALSPLVRKDLALTIDLLPDWPLDKVTERLSRPRGKASLSNHLRKSLRLDAAKLALLQELGRPFPDAMAGLVKALPLRHAGFRPLDEAISTVGGVAAEAVDGQLMLRARPGVFVAGEMLDWDAPTGGYLITACLATGRWAGRHAAAFAKGGQV